MNVEKAINPSYFINSLVKNKILVKLKWNVNYKGILVSFDKYFNICLYDTEEWINNKKVGYIGETLIRCNNVLYVAKIE